MVTAPIAVGCGAPCRAGRAGEAGEWLQQATLAIRAHVPLDIIQPFPTFSDVCLGALKTLHANIAAARKKH
jgi:dihydrolipoamide dehydrogenase